MREQRREKVLHKGWRMVCWVGVLSAGSGCAAKQAPASEVVESEEVIVPAPTVEACDSVEQCPLQAVEVASGGFESCARVANGSVKCWGGLKEPAAVAVDGLKGARALSVGGSRCAIVEGGSVQCGERGYSPDVDEISNAVQLSVGSEHTCAVLEDGTVRCWGSNGSGQLGGSALNSDSRFVEVEGLTGVTSVAVGVQYSCASLEDGSVHCWGDWPLVPNSGRLQPAPIADLPASVAVGASYASVCALLRDGGVSCWGEVVPTSAVGFDYVPVRIPGLANAQAIAVGRSHACALTGAGEVYCWGDNAYGQTSAEPGPTVLSAVLIDLPPSTSISAGDSHSCAVASGIVYCWGFADNGALGTGAKSLAAIPQAVQGLSGAISLSAGLAHTCAVLQNGTARCWGANGNGQLGDGTELHRNVPVEVVDLEDFRAITGGQNHTCAILQDSTIQCWGRYFFGDPSSPVEIAADRPAISVGLDAFGMCAVLQGGGVQCGDFKTGLEGPLVSLTGVDGLGSAVELGIGRDHFCAVLDDGGVSCWGNNRSGQVQAIPDEASSGQAVSVPVTSLPAGSAISVSAGDRHTCALSQDGSVFCWGSNASKQLGRDRNASSGSPVADLPPATAVKAGQSHTCALVTDNRVRCWGSNEYGQLGDGTTTNSAKPVEVPGIANAVALAAGNWHTCALLQDGGAKCWGRIGRGQLGSGALTFSASPLRVLDPWPASEEKVSE